MASTAAAAAASSNLAEKARLYKAEALYGLERYRECWAVLRELRLDHPYNTAVQAQLAQATARLAEQTHGKYHFKQLHREADTLRPPHLDHATYVGPVQVQNTASHGRGLFTTRAVKAGDLLFCEKAFARAWYDEEGVEREVAVLLDPEGGSTVGTGSDLASLTIQKLHRNPSLIPTIADLHHGGSHQPVTTTTQVDGQHIIDSFLLRRIAAINAFGSPRTTTLADMTTTPTRDRPKRGFHPTGIWPLASYLNHSCLGTATRAFIGDFLIARATQDLPASAELTWWYQPPQSMEGGNPGGETAGRRATTAARRRFSSGVSSAAACCARTRRVSGRGWWGRGRRWRRGCCGRWRRRGTRSR